MLLTRTVKVKILTTPNDILPTIQAYTKAYNYICKTGWDDRDCNGISLHKKTYKQCREWLPAQLSVSARMKAAESLKSCREMKKVGQYVSCPESRRCSVRYDANSYNIWIEQKRLSLSTVDGRKKYYYQTPNFLDDYSTWRRKSAELIVTNNKVFLGIVFEKDIEDIEPTQKVLGIDRGIKKIAVTSDNQFFGGGEIRKIVRQYKSLRKRLQTRGTRSAKRHLRKINKKENRFRRNVNHCVSKKIVESLRPGTTIVLEDLTNIRKNSKKFRKKVRFWINGWSFFQLELFLAYKAQAHGCLVDFVDARYTSQKCSRCGHTERANRKSQSIFKCKKCGFQLNADLNAARNICNNYNDAKSYPCWASVNRPIVAASLATSPGSCTRGR